MNSFLLFIIPIQFVSLFVTDMLDFALILHLYTENKSLYFYSYLSLMILIPQLLLSPLIGHFVDKYNKKTLIFLGHFITMICSICMFILIYNDIHSIYFYIFFILINSLAGAVILSSFDILIGGCVKEEHMHYFSGIITTATGIILILCPAVAALLLGEYSIKVIFMLDIFVGFIVSMCILFISFPKLKALSKNQDLKFLTGISQSYNVIKKDRLLMLSLFVLGIDAFCFAQLSTLFPPMLYSIDENVQTIGNTMSIIGIGIVLGGVLSMLIQVKNHLYWFNIILLIQTILLLLLSTIEIDLILLTIGAFLYNIFTSINDTFNYTFWQNKLRGQDKMKAKIFALRDLWISIFIITGYIVSPLLVEFVTRPLIENHVSISSFLGNQLYPEIRLLFIIISIIVIFLTIWVMINHKKKDNYYE